MKISVPGLVSRPTAQGLRYYWIPSPTLRTAKWKSLSLGADLDAAIAAAKARNLEVANWRSGGAKPKAIAKFTRRETIDGLIAQYQKEGYPRIKQGGRRATGQSVSVSPATQREYDAKFRKISEWAGPEPVAAITTKNVQVFRDALLEPDLDGHVRLTGAHSTLRVLRTLLAYAEKKGVIAKGTNPAVDFDLGAPPPRQQVWSQNARAAMEAEAIRLNEPSAAIAIALAPMIAQRQGDMLRLPISAWVSIPEWEMQPADWAILSDAALSPDGRVMGISLRQRKTKAWIKVPVVGDLRLRVDAEIAKRQKASVTTLFIDDRNGLPWDRKNGQTYFQRRFATTRAAAVLRARNAGDVDLADELESLQFRDYRRTGVVMYGELGIADQMIAAITGHTIDETREILETYMPRNTAMAAGAVATFSARAADAKKRKEQTA